MIIIKCKKALICSIKNDICFFKGTTNIYVKTEDVRVFGEYKTEEKAQKVLEELTKTLFMYHNTEDTNLLIDYNDFKGEK